MSSTREIEWCWRLTVGAVDRIVACLNGLTEEDLNWRPVENANSLFVLATHTMANVEENILGILCGQTVKRERDEEFKAQGAEAGPLAQRWRDLKERASSCLARLGPSELDREYDHRRRGRVTGREQLVVVACHAIEHRGQAELTRDLLFASRGRPLPPRDEFGAPIER
jgi:uncharacterized damage-inducible protein DinB